jgi:hypothetical protein
MRRRGESPSSQRRRDGELNYFHPPGCTDRFRRLNWMIVSSEHFGYMAGADHPGADRICLGYPDADFCESDDRPICSKCAPSWT